MGEKKYFEKNGEEFVKKMYVKKVYVSETVGPRRLRPAVR